MKTQDQAYTQRLLTMPWWKRVFDVQLPYRLHMQSLNLGFVLDVGCGLGRNLSNLGGRDAGVGVDHNPQSILVAQQRGLIAYTLDGFKLSEYATSGRFDTLVISHVLEHLSAEQSASLLADYVPYLKKNGRILIITPQDAGFASDPTHVRFMGFDEVRGLLLQAKGVIDKQYSFPFPRVVGRWFRHNEFVTLGHLQD